MARKKAYQRLTRAEETTVQEGILRFLYAIATFMFRGEGLPKFIETLALANNNKGPFLARRAVNRVVRAMADKKLLKLEFGAVTSPNLKHKQGEIVTGVVLTAVGRRAAAKLPSDPPPVAQPTETSTPKKRISITPKERKQQDEWLMESVQRGRSGLGTLQYLIDIIRLALNDASSPFSGRCSDTVRRAVKRLEGSGQLMMIRDNDGTYTLELADISTAEKKDKAPPNGGTTPTPTPASEPEDAVLQDLDTEIVSVDTEIGRLQERRAVLLAKRAAYSELRQQIQDLVTPKK